MFGLLVFIHEFGHYMNEIYNDNAFSQSYDLLEMHSQGNEMIYLAYLKNVLNQTALRQTETYTMLNMLNTIVIALAVDTFEQAVYTDYYDGAYSAEIMADNTITCDEYDLLFKSVIEDFGATGYLTEEYWRYVVIHAPCYYVSYSVSAISVLQLYEVAKTEGFDTAKEALLSSLRGTHDSPGAIENYYSTAALSGLSMTTAEYAARVSAVTASDVSRVAGTLEYHTGFFLKGGDV